MESKDLDKLFRDAFEQAEETPSSCVWEGIQQELEKKKKVVPFYVKYRSQLSIAATFLLFFGVGLALYNKPIITPEQKIEEVLAQLEQNKENSSTAEKIKEIEPPIYATKKEHIASSSIKDEGNNPNVQVIPSVENNSHEKIRSNETTQQVTLDSRESLELVEVELVSADINHQETVNIKPLKENQKPVFAYAVEKQEARPSVVTRVLNGITKNILNKRIDIQENKEIEFSNDEEGSIRLNIINSFAKN